MAIVVPDVSERDWLDYFTDREDVVYHLYQNDYTPSETTVLTDFTEANFTGYAAKTVYRRTATTSPKWQAATTDAGGTTYSQADQDLTWQNTGTTAQTVYGYYVTDTAGNRLLWCARFNAPRTLNQNDSLTLTPRVELA